MCDILQTFKVNVNLTLQVDGCEVKMEPNKTHSLILPCEGRFDVA